MPTQAEVVWDPGFTRYDFGPTHPMSPVRLDLTARLCDAFGLFDHADVHRVDPEIASDPLLETVHSTDYVAARRGIVPSIADMDGDRARDQRRAGLRRDARGEREIVAATRDVALAVWSGRPSTG